MVTDFSILLQSHPPPLDPRPFYGPKDVDLSQPPWFLGCTRLVERDYLYHIAILATYMSPSDQCPISNMIVLDPIIRA